MIGLDTNVLVRYVAQDNQAQSTKATALIESLASNSGFIAIVSIVEMVWVLQSCYQSTQKDILAVLKTILSTKELVVEHADVVWQAVRRFSASPQTDFSDCLIERCANAAKCEYTVTFDRQASKTAGMRHLV